MIKKHAWINQYRDKGEVLVPLVAVMAWECSALRKVWQDDWIAYNVQVERWRVDTKLKNYYKR